jgi:hypothetical protein
MDNLAYSLDLYNIRLMSRSQNWSMMKQKMVFSAHEGTVNLSTKNLISQQAQSFPNVPTRGDIKITIL